MFASDIELENVNVSRNGVGILKNINARFRKGRITTIVGPSGCGKSILLKISACLQLPQQGKILIQGEDYTRISEKKLKAFRENSGFVFQDAALWANKSIYENLSLPLLLHFPSMTKSELDKKIHTLLKQLGYSDNIELRPAQLSTGERKMISFARATIIDPEILFMDSPTSSVDPQVRENMLQLLKKYKQLRKTMIIVTNNAKLISLFADDLIVMKAGSILAQDDFKLMKSNQSREIKLILDEVLNRASTYDEELLDMLNE